MNYALNANMNSLNLASKAQEVKEQSVLLLFALPEAIPNYPTTNLRVYGLHYELGILFSSLKTIREGLFHHDISEFALVSIKLWRYVEAAIKASGTTLDQLFDVVHQAEETWFDMDLHGDMVVAIRDKLFLSNCIMETILSIMTVSMQITQGRKHSFMSDLASVKATMNVAFYASSRPVGGFSVEPPDFSMRHDMLSLIHEAWHFYASVVHIAGAQPTIAAPRSQPVALVPAFLPGIEPDNFPSSPWIEESDREPFLRRFPRAVLESVTTDMRNGNYARAVASIQHLWNAQPKPGRVLMFPECRFLCAQLIVCYFLQGDFQAAEHQVMNLVDSMGDQDLIACTLLHALTLSHLFQGRFEAAKTACSTTIMWKRVLCLACRLDRVEFHEYREAYALRALIYELRGHHAQAETYRNRLPQAFVYNHPASVVHYLNSKSDILGPLIGHNPPNAVGITLAGQGLTEDAPIRFHGAHSLRQKALDYQRTESVIIAQLHGGPVQLSENVVQLPVDDNVQLAFVDGSRNTSQPTNQPSQPIFPEPSPFDMLEDDDSSDDDSSDDELPGPSETHRQASYPPAPFDGVEPIMYIPRSQLSNHYIITQNPVAGAQVSTPQRELPGGQAGTSYGIRPSAHHNAARSTRDAATQTESVDAAPRTTSIGTQTTSSVQPSTSDAGPSDPKQMIPRMLHADPGSVSNDTLNRNSAILPSLRPIGLCQEASARPTLKYGLTLKRKLSQVD